MRYLLKIFLCTAIFFLITETKAEDGYRLWLRYDPVSDLAALAGYTESLKGWIIQGDSPTLKAAGKELQTGLIGLLGRNIPALNSVKKHGAIIAGTPSASPLIASMKLTGKLNGLGPEGYILLNTKYRNKRIIVIAANHDTGVLYGVFQFLRILQTYQV